MAEFVQEIFHQAGVNTVFVPCAMQKHPGKTVRALNSKPSKNKLEEMAFPILLPWKNALGRFLAGWQLSKEESQ